jgi:hypothetical protein
MRCKRSLSLLLSKEGKECKNLECSVNFDVRGVGSSRVKGKRALVVL